MDKNVVVLMSTYNGKLYLKAQIESIFTQTFNGKITIVIRDDGSLDETTSIIDSIVCTDLRNIELIRGENCGPQKSFLNLIKCAPTADFYFFADQDDVWDNNKIEIAVNALQDNENTPTLYCSNYRLSDMDLNVYKEFSIDKKPVFTPLRCLFYNQIPGCTIGFNKCLMVLLKKLELDNIMMHDSMVLTLTAYCGKIIYDEKPLITHRIHNGNVVGDGHKKIHFFRWIKDKIHLLINKEDYDVSVMAQQFLSVTADMHNVAHKSDLELLRDYKKNLLNTIKLLRHKDTKGKFFDRTCLSIRSKIFFHLF